MLIVFDFVVLFQDGLPDAADFLSHEGVGDTEALAELAGAEAVAVEDDKGAVDFAEPVVEDPLDAGYLVRLRGEDTAVEAVVLADGLVVADGLAHLLVGGGCRVLSLRWCPHLVAVRR